MKITRYMSVRPGVSELLAAVAPYYNVHLFTAGFQDYADAVIDKLDITGIFEKRLYNESCIIGNGCFQKDPSLISSDLKATVVVDNDPGTFLHKTIGIEVSDFNEESNDSDREMYALAAFLLSIKDAPDMNTECPKWPAWRND